jgi:beta-1,4-mannosyl-glycoprotein beta-1,4-N-acetylglucosaminyltransferase
MSEFSRPYHVYDCFCYFNEDMLLQLRLETLWDHVDFFVICESKKTISGLDKKLNFDLEKFQKYSSKIRYLIVDNYPFETSDPWRNERYQRDYLSKGLYDAKPSDLIMVSDVDEIPRPGVWDSYDTAKFLRADCEQMMYAYYLNNRWEDGGRPVIWFGTKITTFKNFQRYFCHSMELLRNYKATGFLRGLKRAWFKKFRVQNISNAGWHFTWMAGIDQVIKKLESFAHQEYNRPEYKDPEAIHLLINSGRDILFPERVYVIQEIDSQFPNPLLTNVTRYQSYLLNKVG